MDRSPKQSEIPLQEPPGVRGVRGRGQDSAAIPGTSPTPRQQLGGRGTGGRGLLPFKSSRGRWGLVGEDGGLVRQPYSRETVKMFTAWQGFVRLWGPLRIEGESQSGAAFDYTDYSGVSHIPGMAFHDPQKKLRGSPHRKSPHASPPLSPPLVGACDVLPHRQLPPAAIFASKRPDGSRGAMGHRPLTCGWVRPMDGAPDWRRIREL